MENKRWYFIFLSFLSSLLWIVFGTIFYIDTIASIPALRAISGLSGTKYMLYFLWGAPVVALILAMLFSKRTGVKLALISFVVGTIFFTILISSS